MFEYRSPWEKCNAEKEARLVEYRTQRDINADLLEKALEAYKAWLETPTGPGLNELWALVEAAGFVQPGGGRDFDSFREIAAEQGICKPYKPVETPAGAYQKGPRRGYYREEFSRSGRWYRRYR